MKKLLVLVVIIGSLAVSSTAFAATPTKKELKVQIAQQQAIYDKYVELGNGYLNTILNAKPGWDETIALKKKVDECAKIYLAAADKMQELRVKLYNLEHQ